MKKILSAIILCILSQIAMAQKATDYKFTSTVLASYDPLPETAVTLPGSTTVKGEAFKTTFFNGNRDENVNYFRDNNIENYEVVPMNGIPIGFDFMFADMVCDTFVAAGTGFIFLSPKTDDMVQLQGLASGSMVSKWFPTIGIGVGSTGGKAYGIDGTAIRYLLQGEAGDRTLTVEYTAVSYMDETHPFNFQIKLYEKNSEIELIFDEFTIPNTGRWAIGFEGKDGDHYHLQPTDNQWEQATRIEDAESTYAENVQGSIFKKGLCYRFTPPTTFPPADLTITGLSETEITFDVASNAQGDDILVVLSDRINKLTAPWSPFIGTPEDGKTYQAGDTLYATDKNGKPQIGGRVIYAGKAGKNLGGQLDGLQGNTFYYCAAYSCNKEQIYSISYAFDDTVSPARLPFYEGFNTFEDDYEGLPNRWPGTEGFYINGEVAYTENYGYGETAVLVFPAMEYPENLALRLTLNYHMLAFYDEVPLTKADWADQDSIVIEYSTDGGETFAYAGQCITKQNALDFTGSPSNPDDYQQHILRLPNFGGGKAILRLRYTTSEEQENGIELSINYIYLEAIDLCDYPALLTPMESAIINDKAAVRWVPGDNNETAWNLKTEMMAADGQWQAWEAPKEVKGYSYAFENLPSNRKYRVSLQAVCGVGNLSRWISTEFQSGWTPAFMERFDALEPFYYANFFLNYKMPAHWGFAYESSTRKPDSVTVPMTSDLSPLAAWKTEERTPSETPKDKSISLDLSAFMGSTALRLPTVNIQSDQKPRLVFDYAYGRFFEGELMPVTQNEEDGVFDVMYLWVSNDIQAEKFALKDTVRCWNFATLADAYDQGKVSFDLSGYEGDVVIMIGFYSFTSLQTLFLDNIGVVYDCPVVQHLALQAGSLTETAAALTWQADPTHDSWTVIRRNGATETSETVTGTGIRWDNLRPATTYTVLVGQPCADTSAWSHIHFKTGGTPCHEIENLAVSAIGQRNATLSWNGTAEKYRIRIRPVAATPETTVAWTVYESKSTTYTFSNLTPNTTYEGAVQSVCGEAVGDTADYVAFEPFKTMDITCFAPTEIKATQVDYASATISWQSEAANYQLEYRREGSLDIIARHHCTANEYRLENLDGDTRYEVRLRSICSAGDTSAWSAFTGFSTTTPPACTEPTDLKTEAITLNSARLSWTAAENSTGFIVRYSKSAPIVWDSVRDLTDAQYELTGLEPETVYLWTVMSACPGNRYSDWAARQNFKTSPAANEDLNGKRFEIYADKGQIHILNRAAVPMERIRIYDFQGRLLHDFVVRTNDNAILTTNRRNCMTVVEIESEGQFLRYKVRLP